MTFIVKIIMGTLSWSSRTDKRIELELKTIRMLEDELYLQQHAEHLLHENTKKVC